MDEWIKRVRSKIGHELMFVNSAVGWVEDEQGRVLLQKRSGAEDLWGFPGGILNLGESAEEAVVREVREETGYDAVVDALIGVYTKFFETCPNGDQCQTVSFFFRMRATGGAPRVDGKETFALRFVPPGEIGTLWSVQHQVMLQDAKANRRGVFR
jgi:8-oxo-dGTP pyrophosphatase MutT (NUDIX family)